MELNYKRLHETTVRELIQKTEQSLMYETLVMQLEEEKRKLENAITEKDTEIAKLKKELEDKELLETETQE